MKELRKFLTPDECEYYLSADPEMDIFEKMVADTGGFNAVGELCYKLCKRNSVFLDLGANIGTISVPLAVKGAIVHSFDILASNINSIEVAAKTSGVNVSTHHVAVWRSNGTVSIGGTSAWGEVIKSGDIKISAVKLDSYLYEKNISAISVIKIDIEGSELAALEGMANLLKQQHPDILIESNALCMGAHEYNYTEMLEFLENCGYKLYRVYENYLSPVNSGDIQEVVYCDYLATVIDNESLTLATGFDVRSTTEAELLVSMLKVDLYPDAHKIYAQLIVERLPTHIKNNLELQGLMRLWNSLQFVHPELTRRLKLGAGLPG